MTGESINTHDIRNSLCMKLHPLFLVRVYNYARTSIPLIECNSFLWVNLLKGEHFRLEPNNNNSKLLESYVFIEKIMIECE
jgi:hypothetical protein